MDRVIGWIDSVLRKINDLLGSRPQPAPAPVRVKGK